MFADPPKKKKPFSSDTLIQPGATTSPKTDDFPFEDDYPFQEDFGDVESGSSQQVDKKLTFGSLASMGHSALMGAGHSLGIDKAGDEVGQRFAEFGADPQRATKLSAAAQAENPGSYLAGEIAPWIQPAMAVGKGMGAVAGKAMGVVGKHPAEGAALVAALTPTKIGKAWAVRKFVQNALAAQGAKAAGAAAPEADLLSSALSKAQFTEKPVNWSTPEYLAQQEAEAGNAAWSAGRDAIAPPTPKPTMEEMFQMAGESGRPASLGNAKMAEGISNIPQAAQTIAPPPSTPSSFAEMMNAAGEAGRPGSQGNAAMDAGMQAAAAQQQPALGGGLGRAAQTLSRGMIGAGKIPLSNNTSQASQLAMQALAAGQNQKQIVAALARQFDQATVKFVLAGLPNRLP